ncbi:imelysin family protein [Diaphorobacter nitroreducens]|uniref:imelysin family protein n=1 Tax=Diaphorobacter nitroreducens TaxID=164759 RepID=UPI0035ADA316
MTPPVLRLAIRLALPLLLAGTAVAQVIPAHVAVPFYTPGAFMQGVYRHWYAPRADDFAVQAAKLGPALEQLCASGGNPTAAQQSARRQWQATVQAWDTLSAVAVGPLVQRRSLRQIDFTPTRAELIERAIRAAPADAQAMERVGAPAKGLPALEWLLWTQPALPETPACRYAVLVAQGVDDEARALALAFAEQARRNWLEDEPAAVPAMSELVNQWVGGIERLRWAAMEKPQRAAGGKTPAYPRAASGTTSQSWRAQWRGLQALGVAADNAVPQPGEGLVPLETYLRGRGLNPLAATLARSAADAGREMSRVDPAEPTRVNAATRPLATLKRLAEAQLAPALEVNIGFSDADGD